MATLYSVGDEENPQRLREKMKSAVWPGSETCFQSRFFIVP